MVAMAMQEEIDRCVEEIYLAIAYLLHGGPEELGSYVGLQDWRAELRLIESEGDNVERPVALH